MRRRAALLTALLAVTWAIPASAARVCRMTRSSACCCAEKCPPPGDSVQRTACCEVRAGAPAPAQQAPGGAPETRVPALPEATPIAPVVFVAAAPIAAPPLARATAPPSYLLHSSLLL